MHRVGLSAIVLALATNGVLADVFTNIPEASQYQRLYALDIPNAAAFNATGGPNYAVNNLMSLNGSSIDRVAYYLELTSSVPGSAPQYAFVSMEAFTQKLNLLGIPTVSNKEWWQRSVQNMNVLSNVAGVTNGTGMSGGYLEFWRSAYSSGNISSVPNASDSTNDIGDNSSGPGATSSFGSFQIHNYGAAPGSAPHTILAYNHWAGGAPGNSDVGIGNNTAPNTVNPGQINSDWTNSANAGSYSIKRLEVLVRPGAKPNRLNIMPLGDSITEGFLDVTGGYRSKLATILNANSQPFQFLGRVNNNSSPDLNATGQFAHNGAGGYVINQISQDLDSNVGNFHTRGGFWLSEGVDPDVVLIHLGTNDIIQSKFDGVTGRLEALVNKITTMRPDAKVIVSSIIPQSGLSAANNPFVVAYNEKIENVLVPKLQGLGKKVYFADQYRAYTQNGTVPAASTELLAADGIHPTPAGHAVLAQTFYSALTNLTPRTAKKQASIAFASETPSAPSSGIYNFGGATADTMNVAGGTDAATLVAGNQGAQGQTFTTGVDAIGYLLQSVALRHADYESAADLSGGPDGGAITIRITKPGANGGLEVLREEVVRLTGLESNTIGKTSGSGKYLNITLDSPLLLDPATLYGFDIIGEPHSFLELDGTINSSAYALGEAYTSGFDGRGNNTFSPVTGDRVFALGITPTEVPEPAMATVLALGGGLLLKRTRFQKA